MSSRPTDWSALGLSYDPTPGEADSVQQVVALLNDIAQATAVIDPSGGRSEAAFDALDTLEGEGLAVLRVAVASSEPPLKDYVHVARWFAAVDARPAAARARAVGSTLEFKRVNDEETKRALFPSNYPEAGGRP